VDAGYTLQWNRAALGVGATWLIEAFETWTHPSAVQVLAPPDANTSAGTATLQAFKVHNLDESSAHTVDLTAQNSQAWITGFPLGGAVEVPPLQRVSVPVQVEVPPGVPAGTTAVTSIAATVDGGAPRENAASARLSIIEINYDISSESLDFGTVDIGDSVTRTITVTNLGDPLSISVVGNSDPLAAPFAIAADDCSNTVVAYGESCSISVSMTPTAGGVAADSFNIPIVSPATASHRIDVPGFVPSPPTGHAVSFGLDLFAAGDAASASFSLSNAEVGASAEDSLTSSGG